MILDNLTNARIYAATHPGIARGLEFLTQADLASLTPGRHDIDGDRVYAMVNEYCTRTPQAGRWEAHRRYLDLQSLLAGTERVGYAPLERFQVGPYDATKDVAFLCGSGEFITLHAGEFLVVWPHEAHMPGIAVDSPASVKKIVVKIAWEKVPG